jgi:transcriptional regulator with XRE-family HTH domain
MILPVKSTSGTIGHSGLSEVKNMANLKALGEFLDKRIKEKGWSRNEAARRSKISSSGLSTLLRGLTKPRAETLKALADALDLEEWRLLHLAGMLDQIPTGSLDQSAAYIAKRLTDLPPDFREYAIDALAAQLDAMYDFYEAHKKVTQRYEDQLRGLSLLAQEPPSETLSEEREMTSEELAEFHSIRRDAKKHTPELYEATEAEMKGRGNAYKEFSRRESRATAA